MSDSQYDTGIGPLMAKVLEQQREIARLTAERDEARQQVRDIIQRKEAQMLSIIEEGNGVARVLFKEDGDKI